MYVKRACINLRALSARLFGWLDMSEELLRALMQLFALASDVNDITNESRNIVKTYLESELNSEIAKKYIKVYDHYVEKYHGITADGSKNDEVTEEVDDEVVNEVGRKINLDLQQKQKIVILIRLIEYIFADENISDHEFNFLKLVSASFRIDDQEFEQLVNFLERKEVSKLPDDKNLLIFNHHGEVQGLNNVRVKSIQNLTKEVVIKRFPKVNMFVMRYFGEDNLFLNGQVISNKKSYVITTGSSIRSPKVPPIYFSDIVNSFLDTQEGEKIVFKAKDIEYRFKGGNIGLHKMDIIEEAGGLIGIMGGSGTGKSTLLNVLNGLYNPTHGLVSINGYDINDPSNDVEGIIGYVPQDDLLIEELTVFQNLYYNTKLCFANKSNQEIHQMVNGMLKDLGLESTANLKVGSPMDKTISGGQRKRLNIALELIRQPPVLFADEPTSGLSSRDSENIMDLLKELSLKGKLIFTVIHQPSSDILKMFDKLIILDLGGRMTFYGNPIDGINYFKAEAGYANLHESDGAGHVNPEEIFNIVEAKIVDEYGNLTFQRKVNPDEWEEKYKEKLKPKLKDIQDPPNPPRNFFNIPNLFKQFKVFVTRDVLSKLTDKQYMLINMLESPVLAFVLAYFIRFRQVDKGGEYIFLENENIPAFMFMAVVVALFVGLTVSAEEIIRDQKIRKREKFLNLSNGSYLFSKIVIMFVLSAIQTLTFVLVGNTILGVDGMLSDYWLVLFSAACFANVLGLNISASFKSAVTIYILIPFLIIPQLIFSGVIVKFDKLNPVIGSRTVVPFIGEVMASRWAFEALSVRQFTQNDFEKYIYPYDKELMMADYKKAYWVPRLRAKLGFVENHIEKGDKPEELENNLALIRNEIEKQNEITSKIQFEQVDMLYPDKINDDVIDELEYHLDRLRTFYVKVYNVTTSKKDKVFSKLNRKFEDEGGFNALKQNYRNESLRDLVTNKLELESLVEIDNELVQQNNPVYRDAKGFRAHFFAPTKLIFGQRVDTYWANIAVIWLMTAFLIFALFNDLLKKFVELFTRRHS